ncbi:TetR/AcrR family transcriptional regulator [Arthrobacter sp. LAPM80]|uniref:TetR/AcrR family transcriptional regulator n=1 Tax=Arthrobacter sp. LAPM80 TaxID=3141788 RepID=UPI00398AAF49
MANRTAFGALNTTDSPDGRAMDAAVGSKGWAVDKFSARRAELAAAALATLSDFGYAHTSLREIAQKSGFAHGVFHYYFRDKVDLITYCVREYKAACISHYDEITSGATTAEQVRLAFAAALAASARDDTAMHRLWYDLRNQGMFDKDFKADVAEVDDSLERMVWRIVTTYARFLDTDVALSKHTVYALVDGLFQQAILSLNAGNEDAVASLHEGVWQLLPRLLTGFPAASS